MDESILNSIKNSLGLAADYTPFDPVVIMHTNSVFAILTQLGLGPTGGFMIEDTTPTWGDFIDDDEEFNLVKSHVYTRVRLLYDPPSTSFAIEALKTMTTEFEWRLNVIREGKSWTDPSLSS